MAPVRMNSGTIIRAVTEKHEYSSPISIGVLRVHHACLKEKNKILRKKPGIGIL